MTKEIFFTSDQHYGHANIIKYCSRPFTSVEEMDEALIENHNKTVRNSDTVYMIGDLAFHKDKAQIVKLLKRLNGNKVLITGNHDNLIQRGDSTYPCQIHHRILELTGKVWGGYNPTLCHYPMMSWNASFHGAFQLHGHTHGTIPFDPTTRRLDVGVDSWDYAPVAWDTIVQKLKDIPTWKEKSLTPTTTTETSTSQL